MLYFSSGINKVFLLSNYYLKGNLYYIHAKTAVLTARASLLTHYLSLILCSFRHKKDFSCWSPHKHSFNFFPAQCLETYKINNLHLDHSVFTLVLVLNLKSLCVYLFLLLGKLFNCIYLHCFLLQKLTSSESLLTGVSLIAWLTDAGTGGPCEDRDPVVLAGGTATGVKLLQIVIPTLLQVVQSHTYMVSGCAEAY